MDSCPAPPVDAPAPSPSPVPGGDSFQPALAIVAIMAGSLVSMMFLMVLLAMLALVGAAGFMAFRLIKNETNPSPQNMQLLQHQQQLQAQQYLPAPMSVQQMQQQLALQQQQYLPAPSGSFPAPSSNATPVLSRSQTMEGVTDPGMARTISLEKVREASMAIMEKRESQTSAGFYRSAEQNLDRVVDPSKSGGSITDHLRPTTRTNSTTMSRQRTGSDTAGGGPRSSGHRSGGTDVGASGMGTAFAAEGSPSKPIINREGRRETRDNSLSLNHDKAFLHAASRSGSQQTHPSPAPLQPASKRKSTPSPETSVQGSRPLEEEPPTLPSTAAAEQVVTARAVGNKKGSTTGGGRASLWDIPTDMIAGLRGSKTNTWERRVEVSHREGFVETLNIADKLGAGAFGQVFQCQWEGARAAVKLIDLEGSSDMNKQNSVETFMTEAEVAALLRHPNIVQVYKVNLENFQTGDKQGFRGAIVMEFCELGSLADAINNDMFTFQHSNSPLLDLQLMLKVAEDVARGMLFLHNQDILHGDLKPNNVLLKQHNDGIGAKLTDFGLSVRMSCSQTHVSQHQTGTLDHMAPEVMMEGKSSKRSDVYAYGILLWEVFCCARPYVGMRDVAIVHKVVEENMRPVFPKDAPREYVELASSCWEKEEQKRPEFSEIVARVEQMNLILMRLLNSDIGDDGGQEETTTTSRPDNLPPPTEDPFAEEMDGPEL